MAKITLSNYTVGKIVKAASAKVNPEQTKPPSYFTEATILEEMVAAYKYAPTPAEQEMLKQTKGIGTARTRGDVLKELIKGKYLERFKKGNKIYLRDTPAGRYLSQLAPPALKSVTLTAKWEVLFSQIEKGAITREQFKQVSNQFVGMLVQDAKDKKAKMAR
jgi:DNA topoisomerase IA